MKTLAEFKRRMSSAGTITVVNHRQKKLSGPRRILKTQGNGFWWAMPGVVDRAWTEYPKRSDLVFSGDSVRWLKDGLPFLSINFDSPVVEGEGGDGGGVA